MATLPCSKEPYPINCGLNLIVHQHKMNPRGNVTFERQKEQHPKVERRCEKKSSQQPGGRRSFFVDGQKFCSALTH